MLPIADSWFRSTPVTNTITRIDEPYVHEMLRANVWHIRGTERDLVIDAGLGVASLQDQLPELFANNPILVLTHAHLDHTGSAHEFTDIRMHPGETNALPHSTLGVTPQAGTTGRTQPQQIPASLNGPELADLLGIDWPDAPGLLLSARPDRSFDPEQYGPRFLPVTTDLQDGDLLELGDRTLRVLHLPGHTPGSISLFDDADGFLFSGDVVYDGLLLDELHESNIGEYVQSMLTLRALPVACVYPGHEDPFGRARLHQIIDAYVQHRTPVTSATSTSPPGSVA